MKKDANKKMLQLTTKIIHPSLHLSFALYNKSVVTCHKNIIHIIIIITVEVV